MPRSKKNKRNKKVSLTKLATKGLSGKQKMVLDLRTCVEKYTSVYLFSAFNMRNVQMKLVRDEWRPSRFIFGKISVMTLALGRNKLHEVAKDLHKLSNVLKAKGGQGGLLFTDCTHEEVVDWFANFGIDEYARAGFKVDKTIKFNEGPLKQFPHAMEPYLREKLGLPTKLDKGVVILMRDFEVCKAGDVLTPEQARILELFEYKLAKFRFLLRAKWTKLDGFEELTGPNDKEEGGGQIEEDDDEKDDDDDEKDDDDDEMEDDDDEMDDDI